MSMAQAFAEIALGMSSAFGGPFHDAVALWPGQPICDAGGSIVEPGSPLALSCSVQVDAATESMRAAEGFTEKDMRLLILAASLDAEMNSAAQVQVLAGPHAGLWMVASVDRDPMGIYWECRGRRA